MTLDEIKGLIEFLRDHEVHEFELDFDGVKLRLKGGLPALSPAVPAPAPPAPVGALSGVSSAPVAAAAAPASAAPPAAADEGTELAIVKSPIVGTFYRSAEPGAKAFVSVGDTVIKGQVLCIIEAMKLMNEIDSEYDGEVVSVYVENGQAVQYGERLFAIRLR
jgi:acetyl-CoA carboxylase biotin carboxyl carrier protein